MSRTDIRNVSLLSLLINSNKPIKCITKSERQNREFRQSEIVVINCNDFNKKHYSQNLRNIRARTANTALNIV